MNNIYAEADEILRTSNKKQIVSIILSMQGNYLRAREAEDRLAEARAEIERLKKTAEIIPMKTMETIELNGVEYVRKDLLVLVLKMMEAKGLGEAFMTRLVMVLNNYKTERKLEIDRDDLETPRTDRAAFTANFGGSVVVDADFARQLEIELAEAKAKLRDLGVK